MSKKYFPLSLFVFLAISCNSSKNPISNNEKWAFLNNPRTGRGIVANPEKLFSFLQEKTGQRIDPEKPLVILYYPGNDPCNSSGSTTTAGYEAFYSKMEKRVYEIAGSKPLSVYKDSEGLERYGDVRAWHKDPNGVVERLFFKQHYPCGSFVVVSNTGKYIAFYGEYSNEYILKALLILKKEQQLSSKPVNTP